MPTKEQRDARIRKRMRGDLRRATVAAMVASGHTNEEITEQTGLSRTTIDRLVGDGMERVIKMPEVDRIKCDNRKPAVRTDPEGSALALRIAGWTYDAIGIELGQPAATIRNWVARELDRLHDMEISALDALRRLQLERIDAMLVGLWPKATSGDVKAVDTTLKLLERQAKLLGMDAPERVDVEHYMRQVAEEVGLTDEDSELAVREVMAMLHMKGK